MPDAGPPVLTPREILRLEPEQADELLDRLESEVTVHDGVAEVPMAPAAEAILFGDTHGDWRSTEEVVKAFLRPGAPRWLVGLGDYIDRPPDDCPNGSVANALYLLQLAASRPDRVLLLQGNHEAVRRIGVLPHDLPEEVDDLWGPEVERYERIVALLERGALAVTTESGAYLAHAGFPSRRAQGALRQLLKDPTEELLADILWRDPAASRLDRGVAPPFTEVDLSRFLAEVGASVFVRGHDPDVVGRSLYGDRCLTLHTTRVYERYGGVLLARLPLDHRVRSVSELRVEHLPVEGRSYSPDL